MRSVDNTRGSGRPVRKIGGDAVVVPGRIYEDNTVAERLGMFSARGHRPLNACGVRWTNIHVREARSGTGRVARVCRIERSTFFGRVQCWIRVAYFIKIFIR